MTNQCVLCAQEAEFVGVGQCNHGPFCYRCIYKMRVISKNNQCPICKFSCTNITIMSEFLNYQTVRKNLLLDKNFADIFHTTQAARSCFEKLTQYKCFIKIEGKPCKFDKTFPSVAFLKKHLKDQHNRYFCQICVQKKTCVLQEQKLYTYKALNKHLQKGDIDQFGNVTFMHPYCTFCKKYYFDEDEFRRHINVEHIICNVCNKQERYRYYKNYDSLQVHYKMSHYICNDQNCLAKKFIAFKNAEELRLHRIQYHDRNAIKKIDVKELCGFQYQGHNPDNQIIIIKDKEGVDMEDQFLNLKKCKNKALGQADQQQDILLDPRIFYLSPMDEQEHFQQAFILKHRKQQTSTAQYNNRKKKYVQRSQLQKQKPLIAKQNEHFYIQQLQLINPLHSTKLSYEQFQNKFRCMISNDSLSKFNTLRLKMFKKQFPAQDFMNQYLKMMKEVSLKSAYMIFPHFIRTLTNDDLKQQLDTIYVRYLKKIPSKNDNIISKSQHYSDLFGLFLKELQMCIETRIIKKKLSIKKPIKRCKERLFQIMGVVRRLKIQQMSKFKFATNFGLQNDTLDFIIGSILKKRFDEIQQRLQKIENQQILDLYTFVKFCFNAIKHSKNMHLEKNKIHENILEDFLYQRPQLEKQFGLKKEDLKNLQEKIEFENLQQQKKVKQTLKEIQKKNQMQGYQIKTDFNLVDKGDFPDLNLDKKTEVKTKDNLQQMIHIVKQKPATYQKKINQMFPTLDQQTNESSPKKQQKKKQIKSQASNTTQKAWWQKINEGNKKVIIEQQQQQKVRMRKGKKKQKWVSVKGVFN